jgi:hypothetical protein
MNTPTRIVIRKPVRWISIVLVAGLLGFILTVVTTALSGQLLLRVCESVYP